MNDAIRTLATGRNDARVAKQEEKQAWCSHCSASRTTTGAAAS